MSKVARVLLVPLLTCLSGCVGIAFFHESVKTYSGPFGLDRSAGDFVSRQKNPNYALHLGEVRTKADVLARWGEPAKRVTAESLERWFYHRELGWSGIVPLVIIPIPLVFPLHRDTVLVFSGDTLTAIEKQETKWSGWACGFGLTPHNLALSFGC